MRHLLAAALALAGCSSRADQPRYEYVPEMVDSVAYDSFAPNAVTRDGKTLMAPPAGAIARGQVPFHYGPGPLEATRAGRELVNPSPDTPETLARGEHVFLSFCFPCHGRSGLGDGPVVPRFPMPPSLQAPHAAGLADGQIFHIISRGQGLMPSHAFQVAAVDRWKVIRFVRSLQAKPAAPAAAMTAVVPVAVPLVTADAGASDAGAGDGGDK